SGYICGGLSALCDIVPEPASAYVEVINTDTSGLFVRPAPVAGHVTINGANAKIWDGQRFATTGNVQTVGGGTWREIYLTDNCSQLTGWVSSTFLMFYNGVGINENENALQFEVFPNPGTDNIQLTFHNPENKDYTVTLFNTKGKSVDKHYNTKQIDISKLSDGVYFIKLEQGTLSSSQKFVKLTD
ncbi:MAG: T9SS type A sorting domain-containing protein, partial [Bacteroidia bacterium]|nr:T9SS type A sorting domain-containing protein [Bacteroidia bacterium]